MKFSRRGLFSFALGASAPPVAKAAPEPPHAYIASLIDAMTAFPGLDAWRFVPGERAALTPRGPR